jgi:hypothetical protein
VYRCTSFFCVSSVSKHNCRLSRNTAFRATSLSYITDNILIITAFDLLLGRCSTNLQFWTMISLTTQRAFLRLPLSLQFADQTAHRGPRRFLTHYQHNSMQRIESRSLIERHCVSDPPPPPFKPKLLKKLFGREIEQKRNRSWSFRTYRDKSKLFQDRVRNEEYVRFQSSSSNCTRH